MICQKTTRRQFFGKVAAGMAGAAGIAGVMRGLPLLDPTVAFAATGDMPYRTLGRSGEKVSLVGLGGGHIGRQKEVQESIRIMRTAIDNGVNFMDNCWDYNDGESEVRMGKALLDGYRKKVFLMTKTDGQVKVVFNQQLEECLRRLQTDMIDLVQFHEVIRMEDPDRIFGPSGAMEAALAAKKAGKIRYIGFTGHKDPDVHLKMIETGLKNGYPFDAVQLPLNVMDAHYRSFAHMVVPVLVKHGIGVLGMKSLAGGNILRSKTATPIECMHYAMSLQSSTVIAGCSNLKDLDQALEAARTFRPMGEKDVATLLAKTATAAADGEFEPFKTSNRYDGTVRNPKWLG